MKYESKIYIFQSKNQTVFENELPNSNKNQDENIYSDILVNKKTSPLYKYIIFALFLLIIIIKTSKNKIKRVFNNNIVNKKKLNKKEKLNINFITNNSESVFNDNNNNSKAIIPNKLYWKNEEMNIKSIQNEILYYSKINNISFDAKEEEDFYERKSPKISLVITLYNQINYIHKIYFSIKNQSLKDIEIIFVDDDSKDNSSLIIKDLMEKDKRIIYLKNPTNKGQFYSRNRGVLSSKGEYIVIIDPDDLLLNDILSKAYETAKFYNLEVVQYYHMIGSYENNTLFPMNITGILYRPQVKNVFFNSSDRYLWDKLIKRKTFIKFIDSITMKEEYKNERFVIHNDELVCFGICNIAESYGVLEQIGYFYNRFNPNSTTKKVYKRNFLHRRFRSMFKIMKYYFEHTENNAFEKTSAGYNFFMLRVAPRNKVRIKYLNYGFNFIIQVLDMYLNCSFFNEEQKNNLRGFKDKINERILNITKMANMTKNSNITKYDNKTYNN
jgi:glycosyltransferase involved in cell wall biosynthesis